MNEHFSGMYVGRWVEILDNVYICRWDTQRWKKLAKLLFWPQMVRGGLVTNFKIGGQKSENCQKWSKLSANEINFVVRVI